MARSQLRLWWRLLALALYAVVVAAAFWVGFDLGQARVEAVAEPELIALHDERGAAAAESAALREQVKTLRQESAVLERTRQIERETNRSLQEQLKVVQDERLALIKEGSYLKRLVQEGGRGAIRVHDLILSRGQGVGTFAYGFTVTQLIQEFGESSGQVEVRVTGLQDGEEVTLKLDELPGADPRHLRMHFEHFQRFQGGFSLPARFEPRVLTVTITPDGEQLAGTVEAFQWVLSEP